VAITGPEVARKPTPSSRATICASVVLPRPGVTDKQHVVQRLVALARSPMKIARLARLRLARIPTHLRAQRGIGRIVGAALGRDDAGGRVHFAGSFTIDRVGKGALGAVPTISPIARLNGGHASLCPPYGLSTHSPNSFSPA